jgi:hypothetical protein
MQDSFQLNEKMRLEKLQVNFEKYLSASYTLKNKSLTSSSIFAPTYFSDRKIFSISKNAKSILLSNRAEQEILLTYIHTTSHLTRMTRQRAYTDIYYDSYPVYSFSLARSFGRTLIRSENLLDKITELFNRIEVDFPEHPKFSSRYFCLSSDPDAFRKGVNSDFTNCLLRYKKNVYVEFSNKTCVVHNQYNVSNPKHHSTITEFVFALQKQIGK